MQNPLDLSLSKDVLIFEILAKTVETPLFFSSKIKLHHTFSIEYKFQPFLAKQMSMPFFRYIYSPLQ